MRESLLFFRMKLLVFLDFKGTDQPVAVKGVGDMVWHLIGFELFNQIRDRLT